jgi:phage terminase Nu1 subunit (DNA packaging protein)
MIVNRSKLAKIFGVSPTTISRWVDQGMPVDAAPDGGETRQAWRFDTVAVLEWHKRHTALFRSNGMAEALADATLREKWAAAGLRELELGRRRGVMVHVQDAGMLFSEQLVVAKSRLTRMHSRLADQLAAERDEDVCRRMLQEEVEDILSGLDAEKIMAALRTPEFR